MLRTGIRSVNRSLASVRLVHSAEKNENVATQTAKVDFVNDMAYRGSIEDIPGPKALPIIGNVFRFVPYIGEYGNVQIMDQLSMLRESYGNIVKLDGILNRRTTIFLFSPELCERMYRQQGVWPVRTALESLHHYRQSRKQIYGGIFGLTTSQGKMWHDFRSRVNQFMMQPRAVKPHVNQINEIADEFLAKIRKLRCPTTQELPANFNNEVNKWALESMSSIAMNKRLGCLKWNLAANSEPQTMINCVHTMFEMMYRLELRPSLWKIFPTSDLRQLFSSLDTLNGLAMQYISEAREKFEAAPKTESIHDCSVLQKLLQVDETTARVMSLDMLTAGVDTTGNSSAALLYYIATNPEKQETLRKEVTKVLPEKDTPITTETLNQIPYGKACIKESLRLFPISIGTLRTMQHDVILDGYRIPEGSDIVAAHAIISRDPTQFPEPLAYIPERWLRNTTEYPTAKSAHPFSYMPFGFGARTCIGRRFAELEMEVLLLKMVRNFQLEWQREPIQYQSRFINTVSTPLQLKLIDL